MSDPPVPDDDAIAVIGMAVRVPGAADIEQFWENLVHGRESVVELDEQTLRQNGVRAERLADENYVRAAAPVAHIEYFDADFFGLTPRDAAATDPQIKLFLEIAHATIENAGYDPVTTDQTIGVMAAAGPSRYVTLHLNEDAESAGGAGLGLHTLNSSDYLATTTSYRLNLRGPSITVLAACSSSLVALHLACQSLRAGDCDAIVVGGANVEFPVGHGYLWTPGSILSRDGHCRPFDAAANGTVFGSGAAAVLLKPLTEARRDGDRISAIVLGSAVNNDGADKVSFGAPSITGQASVIMEAMRLAGVEPAGIDYVEMHGTGTPLGDPIEVTALTEAYAALADDVLVPGSCGIGSVKGNVGHLGPVAGIIGFIRTLLAFDREQLPPTINLDTVNPRLDLGSGPFEPVREVRSWPRTSARPRRAGVSSLGIGGSNAHVVLAEAPDGDLPFVAPGPRLVVWSGRDARACLEAAERLGLWFTRAGELDFADGAATAQHGRTAHAVRRAVVAADARDAAVAVLDETRLLGPDTDDPVVVPGRAAAPDGAFRTLAERVPAFAAALTEVLDGCGEPGRLATKQWTGGGAFPPLLVLATRVALVRTWLNFGAAADSMQAPPDIPDLFAALDGVLDPADAIRAIAPVTDAGGADALWTAHLAVLGRIWTSGVAVDWTAAGCPPPRRRAALPGYPYRRARHWTPPHQPAVPRDATRLRPDVTPAAWYPVWQDAGPARSSAPVADGTVLALLGPDAAAARTPLLALRQLGHDVARYAGAPEFAESDGHFCGRPEDLHRAVASLHALGRTPTLIVDALGFGAAAADLDALALPVSDDLPPRLVLTSRGADVCGCDPVGAASAALARQALAADPDARWLDAPEDTTPERLAAAMQAVLSGGAGSALAVRGTRRWLAAAMPLHAVESAGGAVGALDRRAGSVLVVDGEGTVALGLTDALASAGVAASLLVITAAGAATTDALLALEDLGPTVDVLDWDGEPGTLPAAVARAVRNARLTAVVVAASPTGAGALLHAAAAGLHAAAAGLREAVPTVAAVVCHAADVPVHVAAATSGAIDAACLGAERAFTLLTADPSGPALLDLLTAPAPDLVVSSG